MKANQPYDDVAAFARHSELSRRRSLRSAGVALALPAFETLCGTGAGSAVPEEVRLASTASGAPLRTAFLCVPNGVHQGNWWPKTEGKDFDLTLTLQPLAKVKSQLLVLGGLDHVNATAGPDGPGDHARATGTFLTGVRVRKTAGANIHAGISVDQVAAQQVGHLTRFPSLELSCEGVRKSGNCDSGYSCAYSFNISWRSPTMPMTPEHNPRLVFERLFGAGPRSQRKHNLELRRAQERSILDFVRDDTRALEGRLGRRDQEKLGEFLSSVREIERRIEQAERFKDIPNPSQESPAGVPANPGEHVDLMFDMMVLAFQTDSTRICTFLLAGEGSNRSFPDIGIPEGHHNLSHHFGNKKMIEKIAQIDLWYTRHLARFLEKLQETKDVDGESLLHNSMIVYGSGNSDGNRHTHVNLPVLVAGGAGGALNPGRFVKHKAKPMSNLYLTMLDRMGVKDVPRLGDSTGRLEGV
jgi:Protein of unknown function (DUF1552)